jgi:hypothetical protein
MCQHVVKARVEAGLDQYDDASFLGRRCLGENLVGDVAGAGEVCAPLDAQPQQRHMFGGGQHRDDQVAGLQLRRERRQIEGAGGGATGEAESGQAVLGLSRGASPQQHPRSEVAEDTQAAARGQAGTDPVDGSTRNDGLRHRPTPLQ